MAIGLQCQLTLLLVVLMVVVKTTSAFLLTTSQCLVLPPCSCSATNINCGSKALTNVPKFISSNVNGYISDLSLYLYNNHITSIPANAFQNLSSANISKVTIRLDNNMISNIDLDAFSGVENKTKELNLRNNKLTNLPSALRNLYKLEKLYIEGNHIGSLDASILFQLSQYLTSFGFDMVGFSDWPTELSMLHLLELIIQKIPFSHLPLNAFAGSESKLTSLTLSESKLVRIPSAVCHLQNLQTLFFNFNVDIESNVTLFEPCSHNLTHLKTLDLNYDNLFAFPDIMRSFPSLTGLYLIGNKIQFIHTNVIPESNKLTYLHIEQNQLTRIPFALNKLKNLENLYMNNNEVSTVEDHDLVGLSSLETLDLLGNPIKYVSPHAFPSNTKLRSLGLGYTRLHLIPEAVRYLPQLATMSFSGNNADCSCRMSYLKGWDITAFLGFYGVCGNENREIKQFIMTQLPNCP